MRTSLIFSPIFPCSNSTLETTPKDHCVEEPLRLHLPVNQDHLEPTQGRHRVPRLLRILVVYFPSPRSTCGAAAINILHKAPPQPSIPMARTLAQGELHPLSFLGRWILIQWFELVHLTKRYRSDLHRRISIRSNGPGSRSG
jgi:hypothetical protein